MTNLTTTSPRKSLLTLALEGDVPDSKKPVNGILRKVLSCHEMPPIAEEKKLPDNITAEIQTIKEQIKPLYSELVDNLRYFRMNDNDFEEMISSNSTKSKEEKAKAVEAYLTNTIRVTSDENERHMVASDALSKIKDIQKHRKAIRLIMANLNAPKKPSPQLKRASSAPIPINYDTKALATAENKKISGGVETYQNKEASKIAWEQCQNAMFRFW